MKNAIRTTTRFKARFVYKHTQKPEFLYVACFNTLYGIYFW